MFSFSVVLARRTARVIIWAPASRTAASISSREYFPEPKINREVNSLPPRLHVSCVFMAIPSFFIFQ